MKEKLLNNLGLKILSILFAFFVWLVVVNVSNPWISGTKEVPLDIENGQVLLAAGRTYELSGKSTVTVAYDVRTRDSYKIRSADFRASVDLADLYDVTGSVEVKIDVLNNKEMLRNVAARPGVMRVATEELQTKQFDVTKKTSGETEAGYAPNLITTSPEQVTVSGPISQVGLISFVGIEVDLSGLSESVSGTAPLKFFDSNGNELTLGDKVTADVMEVNYNIEINRVKEVSLDFEVSGTAASGFQYAGVESSVRTVDVVGLKSSLASFNKITVPGSVLNVDGAAEDKVVTVDLRQYLPEGVEIVKTENPQIEVRLKVEALEIRTFHLTKNDILMTGAAEHNTYDLVPERIDVRMQGLGEDLESLTVHDLGAALNVTGMETGTHKGVLTFGRSDVFKVLSYTEFEVRVEPKNAIVGEGPATSGAESSSQQTETTAKPSQSESEEASEPAVPADGPGSEASQE